MYLSTKTVLIATNTISVATRDIGIGYSLYFNSDINLRILSMIMVLTSKTSYVYAAKKFL